MIQIWKSLGQILVPQPKIRWMSACTGASFAMQRADSALFDVYVTGRDEQNRSLIGRVTLDLEAGHRISDIPPEPVLDVGELGAFDENGVSYPCLVTVDGQLWLYYTGWMPTVLTPFQNHVGLAVQQADGKFQRVSRAPILPRNDADYLSMGSVFVLREPACWRMWYTSWTKWTANPTGTGHQYCIKYAESRDGRNWERPDLVAIGPRHPHEHSIAKPSVWYANGLYHMWYCYRGDEYRIGYALSTDGRCWKRRDESFELKTSGESWDAQATAYPHVFRYRDQLFMLYCGNHYGREGLGLATLDLRNLPTQTTTP